MDAPIGPLDAHYHTRGAMYYVLNGQGAKFVSLVVSGGVWPSPDSLPIPQNDEAAPNDVAMPGELRFVAPGVYYGPEELDR